MLERRTLGTVTAIDRANGFVRGVLDTGEPITASYFGGRRYRMPWPLCTALFVSRAGEWTCMGPIGDRREILHDDFTYVATTVPTGFPGTAFNADTPWRTTNGAAPAAGVSQGAFAGSDHQGSAALLYVANAATSQTLISKIAESVYLPGNATAGLWVSARIAASTFAGNGQQITVGLQDLSAGGAYAGGYIVVAMGRDAAGTLSAALLTRDTGAGVEFEFVSGVVPTANQWFWVDVVWSEGFGAGWIDGDGPYVVTESIPANALESYFGAADSTKAANITGYLDTYTLQAVDIVNDPTPYQLN